MSEPMDLTLPTHSHIYACSLQAFTIPEPGVPPQLSYPTNPPYASSSVPPYFYSSNRCIQTLQSPPIISPPIFLPNVNSLVIDNALHISLCDQHGLTILHVYHHPLAASFHQPAQHTSPVLSYASYHSLISSLIAAPVAQVPILDLDQSFHNHSHTASLQQNPAAPLFYPMPVAVEPQ